MIKKTIQIKTKKAHAVAELKIEIDENQEKKYCISNYYNVGSRACISGPYKKTKKDTDELKEELIQTAISYFNRNLISGAATQDQEDARKEMKEILKPNLFGNKTIKFHYSNNQYSLKNLQNYEN